MALAHRRFTVAEYHRMAMAGVLHEDDRVELIDGQVVEMAPIGPRHAGCVKELVAILYRRAGGAVTLGVQDPVTLGEHWEPEPDIAVLRPRPRGYRTRHPGPGDILLIIEVADTSIEYDRSVKLPGYARAGIGEVWLVNLPADRIEVYREPRNGAYARRRILNRDATLTAIALPDIPIEAREILG